MFVVKVRDVSNNMGNREEVFPLGIPSPLCLLHPAVQTWVIKQRSEKASSQRDICHHLSSCRAVWIGMSWVHLALTSNNTRPNSPWTPFKLYSFPLRYESCHRKWTWTSWLHQLREVGCFVSLCWTNEIVRTFSLLCVNTRERNSLYCFLIKSHCVFALEFRF